MTQRLVENTLHTLAHFRLYRLIIQNWQVSMLFTNIFDSLNFAYNINDNFRIFCVKICNYDFWKNHILIMNHLMVI